MQLKIYGNNATCPEANGACSCYLLHVSGKRILIDMGNAALTKLQQDVDLASIDTIIISHLHFDHMGDLFCAKYQLESRAAYGEVIAPIPLYCPRLPMWAQRELETNNVFAIHTVEDGLCVACADVQLSFYAVPHLIESYALRVQVGEQVFAYSGDSGKCDVLQVVAQNADVFLSEATFTSAHSVEEGHHLSASTAARIAKQASVRKLLLTHYHTQDEIALLEEARSIFDEAEMTHIGDTYAW